MLICVFLTGIRSSIKFSKSGKISFKLCSFKLGNDLLLKPIKPPNHNQVGDRPILLKHVIAEYKCGNVCPHGLSISTNVISRI